VAVGRATTFMLRIVQLGKHVGGVRGADFTPVLRRLRNRRVGVIGVFTPPVTG
jgi:hypothetical protein